jgi:ABC-2 type transport system permease protein
VRWLLVKDLTVLRRSPLLTALLVLYPIVIAVLIGFALSGGPSKPRVAFLNEVPEGTPLNVGGEQLDQGNARDELCGRIDCIDVGSEQEARDLVASGEVLGALILPPDLIQDLQSLTGLEPEQPTVKVLVNEEDPVKAELVDDRITTLLAEANLRVSQQISDVSVGYLGILLDGGSLSFLGQDFSILGLRDAEHILTGVRENLPPGAKQDREDLDQVIRFASLAAENLDVADDLLAAVQETVQPTDAAVWLPGTGRAP